MKTPSADTGGSAGRLQPHSPPSPYPIVDGDCQVSTLVCYKSNEPTYVHKGVNIIASFSTKPSFERNSVGDADREVGGSLNHLGNPNTRINCFACSSSPSSETASWILGTNTRRL